MRKWIYSICTTFRQVSDKNIALNKKDTENSGTNPNFGGGNQYNPIVKSELIEFILIGKVMVETQVNDQQMCASEELRYVRAFRR